MADDPPTQDPDVEQPTSRTEADARDRIDTLIEHTMLSPQEAEVFVQRTRLNRRDAAEALDISVSHFDAIRYQRIPEKLQRAQATIDECVGEFTFHSSYTPDPNPYASQSVGCAGRPPQVLDPYIDDCPNDVETNVTNPDFDSFLSLTINQTSNDSVRGHGHTTYRFCSLECLQGFLDRSLHDEWADDLRTQSLDPADDADVAAETDASDASDDPTPADGEPAPDPGAERNLQGHDVLAQTAAAGAEMRLDAGRNASSEDPKWKLQVDGRSMGDVVTVNAPDLGSAFQHAISRVSWEVTDVSVIEMPERADASVTIANDGVADDDADGAPVGETASDHRTHPTPADATEARPDDTSDGE